MQALGGGGLVAHLEATADLHRGVTFLWEGVGKVLKASLSAAVAGASQGGAEMPPTTLRVSTATGAAGPMPPRVGGGGGSPISSAIPTAEIIHMLNDEAPVDIPMHLEGVPLQASAEALVIDVGRVDAAAKFLVAGMLAYFSSAVSLSDEKSSSSLETLPPPLSAREKTVHETVDGAKHRAKVVPEPPPAVTTPCKSIVSQQDPRDPVAGNVCGRDDDVVEGSNAPNPEPADPSSAETARSDVSTPAGGPTDEDYPSQESVHSVGADPSSETLSTVVPSKVSAPSERSSPRPHEKSNREDLKARPTKSSEDEARVTASQAELKEARERARTMEVNASTGSEFCLCSD